MSVTVHDVAQRSPEWFQLRLGRLTSSVADDMLATNKDGKPSASKTNLLVRLALEILTNRSHEREVRVTQAMQDGIDREADATARYEELTGRLVFPCGFISHNQIRAGTSPDGLVGQDGTISIKCPIPATHLSYLETGVVPLPYLRQIHHEQFITGRKWTDFFSYCPAFAELGLDAKLVRVYRHEPTIEDYQAKALAFLREVDLKVDAVRTMANLRGVLEAATA